MNRINRYRKATLKIDPIVRNHPLFRAAIAGIYADHFYGKILSLNKADQKFLDKHGISRKYSLAFLNEPNWRKILQETGRKYYTAVDEVKQLPSDSMKRLNLR